MKIYHRAIERDGSGSIALEAEETEDMWHIYNILTEGDKLKATTIRRVQTESAAGSVESQRVRTTLCIEATAIEFDTQACMLRVAGRCCEENPHVRLGAYHTIDLELNRKFTITKGLWDSVALERVNEAADPAQRADAAACVMEEGLAHVCLLTQSMTIVRARIEMSVPRKGRGTTTQHDRGKARFFHATLQAILRHINFDLVKCVIIASPGFVRDEFYDYVFQTAVREENKTLIENRAKFLKVHSSSGHKHALKEVLADATVLSRLANTKAATETRTLDEFYRMLSVAPERAFYGFDHVSRANDEDAIETLMVTDTLFRSASVAERKRYVALVESVKEKGGAVLVFSSLHVTGEQLSRLSGVAAILRFPLPGILEEDRIREQDGSDSDSDSDDD